VIRDDMDSVYPLLRQADVLVFATPLHFFCWSAPLKTLVDRMYCLAPKRKHSLKGKQTLLLATAADDTPAAFAGLKATWRLVAGYMQWKPSAKCSSGCRGRRRHRPQAPGPGQGRRPRRQVR
jgi:NAD(P)H-dependent FMN reductase